MNSSVGLGTSVTCFSVARLGLLSGLAMLVIISVDLLSGLTFGLLLDLPKTSLNLLAGDTPRSMLMLPLRDFGRRVSARSINPTGGEAGFNSGAGTLPGEGDPLS